MILHSTPIILNTETRTAHVEQRELQLTRKEFRLLEFFLKNKGRVISAVEVLENVWGRGYVAYPKYVIVFVSALRKKLGEFSQMLETVQGHGYMLRDGGGKSCPACGQEIAEKDAA